jgi:hypothetical protein
MRLIRTILAAATTLALVSGFSARGADAPACPPLPAGMDAVLKAPTPIIWFGEMHGTNEMPALFGDAVCAAGRGRRPVIVALERSRQEQPLWEMFLKSDGGDSARGIFLTGVGWSGPEQDGRSSKAMLALAERLRQLKQAGRIQDVELFDVQEDGKTRDQGMADDLMAVVNSHPDAVVLAYSGNVHNMGAPFGNQVPARSLLPAGTATSVDIIGGAGGRSWNYGTGDHPSGGTDHAPGVVPATTPESALYARQGYDYVAFLGKPTTASAPALAEAFALAAPVHDAFVKAEAEQAALPPAKTDSERLERMLDLDQVGRNVIVHIDFSTLPPDQRLPGQFVANRDIQAHDLADQKALKAMMPATGWFTQPEYSAKAVDAAFLIVQHAANDPDLMRDALKRMEPLVKTGRVKGESYALLYDRVSLFFDHKPQRYGSQVECKAGHWQPQNLEDPDHVDERRKAVGMVMTEADYLKYFADHPCH